VFCSCRRQETHLFIPTRFGVLNHGRLGRRGKGGFREGGASVESRSRLLRRGRSTPLIPLQSGGGEVYGGG
jgi:hypothetical protein